MPLPPKKKKADFALLLGEPEEKPEDALDDAEPDEDMDDLALEDELDDEPTDPLLDDMGGEAPSLDPEQAALCETLGFSDPEQQQALVDLIKLVNSPDPMATESDMPPLPESPY